MDERRELTDEQWERLVSHLPPQRPPIGKPNRDHRTIVEGMFWRLRTGAPWRDLPERYGPWQTVYSRFRRWLRAGVWERALRALQAEGDAAGELDWALHFLDATTVRAHQHAAGAQKGAAIRPSAAPGAGFRPKSTCAPRVGASRSSSP
jgi:transposase